jgi:hypothetical protein
MERTEVKSAVLNIANAADVAGVVESLGDFLPRPMLEAWLNDGKAVEIRLRHDPAKRELEIVSRVRGAG